MDRNHFLQGLVGRGCVALRKESVDRNGTIMGGAGMTTVALRKESVERNAQLVRQRQVSLCRSPQGERG